MGWDSLFAGLLAGWIVDRREQKERQRAQIEQVYSSSGSGSISERLFITARNKQLTDPYIKVCLDNIDNPKSNFGIITLHGSYQEKLRYYYSRLEVNPSSFDCRTELVHFILKSWKDEDNVLMIDLLQNELIYMIDYMHPHKQEERMYQHLAMFLSAECYFFKGEFAKALKRLYQVLDWQEIYDNVDNNNGIDFNGLYFFHEATVSNIINLYALSGLSEKTDEVRVACKSLMKEVRESYYSLMSTNSNSSSMRDFIQGDYDMIMARDRFQGYRFISDTSYKSNLFKESVTGIIRGQAIYSIETISCNKKSFSVFEDCDVVNNELKKYNSLCLQGYGIIKNYEAALNRDREEMRSI